MGQFTLKGEDGVVVDLRRSARARRISLRVSSLDGRVTLTVPNHVRTDEARDFAEEKVAWIKKALDKQKPTQPVVIGAEVPIEGDMFRIEAGQGRAARVVGDAIKAPSDRVGASVQALLKALARDRLSAASLKYATMLGRDFRKITLRDTRSRWGSCSHDGNLMYSWRLILATPDVLDYVAAHEVAHLEHMDHSSSFWRAVADLCPDYAEPRAWLRRHGADLHRYRFSSND